MASPKPQVSCSAASVCKESSVVQVSDSSEPLAQRDSPVQVLDSFEPLVQVTTAAVTADVVFLSPPPEQSLGLFRVAPDTADVAERLPLPPQQSSAGLSVAQEEQPGSGPSGRRTHLYVEEIKSQWNLRQVFTKLGTQEDCIRFCEEQGLILVTRICSYHKRPMKLSTAASHGQLGVFRCTKSNCRMKPVSRSQGTWFENMHLALTLIFEMMYLFSHGATYDDVQRETTSLKTGTVVSTKTIADWYSYCRETITIYEIENQIYETKIGGPNKIVQIYESKFRKRKYNRGRHIEGQWVLRMIENGSDDLRLEVCPNNERSAEALVPLIQKHVAEGTIIHTDFWRAYDCLPEYGYIHKKVNHSNLDNRFVAPDGTHTQRIESYWRGLKRQFQKDQYKSNFVDWLAEHSWRRKNRIYNKDPFEELLKAIKYVYKLD